MRPRLAALGAALAHRTGLADGVRKRDLDLGLPVLSGLGAPARRDLALRTGRLALLEVDLELVQRDALGEWACQLGSSGKGPIKRTP